MGNERVPDVGKRKYVISTILFSLLILLGVGTFTGYFYERIVDNSKTIAWEMTLKSTQMLELRLDNIRRDLYTFTQEIALWDMSEEELREMTSWEMVNHPVFRTHVIADDGTFLTDLYGITEAEARELADRCPEDGVFSENYVGKSGRWQTAIAYSGTFNGTPCRAYQECIMDELYMNNFMEFYNNQGYSYVISRENGEFLMLPQNRFGQGMYAGLFALLEAYKGNKPEMLEQVREALAMNVGCTIQTEFRGEKSFFCFVPVKENDEWFVVSVIPSAALQRNGMTAIAAVVLMGIVLLLGLICLMLVNRRRWKLVYEMQAAKLADQAKTSFLSNMSHEMRTPMNAIMGMTEIMRRNLSDPVRIEACIDKIHASSRYLLGIINDVLDMSKIEKNKMTLEQSPFLISSAVDTAVDLIMPQLKQHGHDFTASVCWDGPEHLIGDEKRISQILVNILINAVKYTPEGGDIRLRIFSEKDRNLEDHVTVRFEIEDNGIGMSREYQALIFEPFSQEKNSLSKGTGLGMAITAQIVRMMNGDIKLESELNKGSTFRVWMSLPTALPDDGRESSLSGKKILVVEESRESREAIRRTLAASGARVGCVGSSEEALAALSRQEEARKVRAQSPDANEAEPGDVSLDMVLLDCRYANTAKEFLEAVRNLHIPLYMMGYGMEQDEGRCGECGNGFLIKPLFPSRLERLAAGAEHHHHVETPDAETPLAGVNILLAEDNDLNAEIAIELLTYFGAAVDRCEDGRAVCERFRASAEGEYDLVLMDIQMPRMNGYEAAAAIRAMKRQDAVTIPILAMTADAFSEDVARAECAGMNGHIAKPVDIGKLLPAIQRVTTKKGETG